MYREGKKICSCSTWTSILPVERTKSLLKSLVSTVNFSCAVRVRETESWTCYSVLCRSSVYFHSNLGDVIGVIRFDGHMNVLIVFVGCCLQLCECFANIPENSIDFGSGCSC